MPEPTDLTAAVAASLSERTGRTLQEWVALVRDDGPDPLDQNAVRRWLKERYGLLQNTQWTIAFAAAEAAGWRRPDVDGYADQVYAGAKAGLRPLHEAVVAAARCLGDDVEPQGRSTYIPLVRKTQFAAIAPGPRGTLRIGFRYRTAVPDDPRLAPAKGFAQATHWIHLAPDSDDEDVRSIESLLAAAYDQNG